MGEAVDFLDWLLQLNFVLLGYREYELLDSEDGRAIRAVPGSGLGILADVSRSNFASATPLDSLAPDLRHRIEEGDLLVLSKTSAYSTVHRRARMDYIGIRRVGPDGQLLGEARLIGLFTSKAYMEPAAKTPLLHHKLEQILAAEDLIPGSHDYKAAVELFGSFPKDELFQASTEELRQLVVGLLQLEKHGGIRVLVRRDIFGRQVSVVVALPREKFTAALRKRLQQMVLERFHGTSVDYSLSLGETESAKIFFTVHLDAGHDDPGGPLRGARGRGRAARPDLGRRPARRARQGVGGPRRGEALAEKYSPRFPDYYKVSETDWALAVEDVLRLEELETADDGFVVGIGNEASGERLTRVKLYKTGGKADLSSFMPLLESLGLRAVEEIPVQLHGEGKVYIHDFGVLDARGAVLELDTEASRDRGRDRRDVARRGGGGLAQPPGHVRRPHVASGAGPARLPPVPDARVLALHRGVPQRCPGGEPAYRGAPGRAVRAEVRPRDAGVGGGRGGDTAAGRSRTCRRSPRSTRTRSSGRSWGRSAPPSARTRTSPNARTSRSSS